MKMKRLLEKFESSPAEIVFEWNDSESEARGWLVINTLRGAAAGGGTRMCRGLDRHEVESLAKIMEIKFTVCGPKIGGGKSGIDFNPHDPRKEVVLRRWYRAILPLLQCCYGTGGDLNIDEMNEVIPITKSYGLKHPQEGIVNAHLDCNEAEKSVRIRQLQDGVSQVIELGHYVPSLERRYTIADMITGYGVVASLAHYYELWGGELTGKRAIIQGWGNVGAATGFYLAQAGVRIIGIIDKHGGVIHEDGYDVADIRSFFLNRNGNQLNMETILPHEEVNASIWDCPCDIFVPAAGSRLVSQEQIQRLQNAGLELISCGANVPFDDQEIFYGPTYQYADKRLSVIPDFVANCGMARVFAYLMQPHADLSDQAIFEDTSRCIKNALIDIIALNSGKREIANRALQLALTKLL